MTELTRRGQLYIDDLVKDETSPYARKVIYDHNGSLSENADYLHARRSFKCYSISSSYDCFRILYN